MILMPIKDPDKRRAYARAWYARSDNRERTIAKVAKRKKTDYAGVCLNCGGPTVGQSKDQAPKYCGKPKCRSAQRIGQKAVRGASYEIRKEPLSSTDRQTTIREVTEQGGSTST